MRALIEVLSQFPFIWWQILCAIVAWAATEYVPFIVGTAKLIFVAILAFVFATIAMFILDADFESSFGLFGMAAFSSNWINGLIESNSATAKLKVGK